MSRLDTQSVTPPSPFRIVLVTMTKARHPSEAKELITAVRSLAATGLPLYIGEGGSPRDFVAQLGALPNTQLVPLLPETKPTLVNQLRGAFAQARARDPDYIFYTEPDKRAFFAHGLPVLLKAAQADYAADILLAARTPRGFATFPQGQRVAETFMNRLCSDALGQVGDYTYGPMILSRRLIDFTLTMPADLGWGWRFFIMAIARQLRLRIQLCPVRTQCPRSQRDEDDLPARDYRVRQLTQNVTGLARGWTCLLDQELEANSTIVAAA